jgi:kynurenine formamidase
MKVKRIIDLSPTLYPSMPSWQTQPELRYELVKKVVRDNSTVSMITQMHMHIGTHVDAPLHSIQEGRTIDTYPVERFLGEGIVLNFRHKNPSSEITETDLRKFDNLISPGEIVMLCTDWSKKRGFNTTYLYQWPYLGPEACQYLAQKKIKTIGTEGLSIGPWSSPVPAQGPVSKYTAGEIHRLLLEKEILIVEGLCNLSDILGTTDTARAFFVFAPLNFVGSEASPCRALGFLTG